MRSIRLALFRAALRTKNSPMLQLEPNRVRYAMLDLSIKHMDFQRMCCAIHVVEVAEVDFDPDPQANAH